MPDQKYLPVSRNTNLNKFDMTEIETFNYIILFRFVMCLFYYAPPIMQQCLIVTVSQQFNIILFKWSVYLHVFTAGALTVTCYDFFYHVRHRIECHHYGS